MSIKPELAESFRKTIADMIRDEADVRAEAYALEKRLQSKRLLRLEIENKMLDLAESNGIAGCRICTSHGSLVALRHKEDCWVRLLGFARGEIDFDGNPIPEPSPAPKEATK